jgi:toxin ParE1/3/4
MKRLKISRPAEVDLLEIWIYLAEKDLPAGRLLRTITGRFADIRHFPDMGRARPEWGANFRSLVVEQYIIVYDNQEESVEILRVLHGATDVDTLWREQR